MSLATELAPAARSSAEVRPLRPAAALLLALVAVGLVVVTGWVTYGFFLTWADEPLFRTLLDGAVGIAYLAAGLAVWLARPASRTGRLMYAAGALFFVANLSYTNVGALVYPALGMGGLFDVAVGIVILSYPTGRLRERRERLLAVTATVWVVASSLVEAITIDTRACESCLPNPWYQDLGATLVDAWPVVSSAVSVLLWLCFVALVARRWRQASPVARRWLAPLWFAGLVTAGVRLVQEVVTLTAGDETAYALSWTIADPLTVVVPIALAWGLLRGRLAQASVGDLVVELGQPGFETRWQDAIGRALGDPSVLVALDAPEGGGRLVDIQGRTVDPLADGRVVTSLAGAGASGTYLVHDPSLAANPGLVRAVAAAMRLALDNQRLTREVEEQLLEVRASRTRIVEASDAERARVERNLHDGAQQRLVTLTLRMRAMAGAADDAATAASWERLATELEMALGELRELARGIHPAAVIQGGLAAAVEGLAERTTLPVRVDIPPERWPPGVEVAAWFVVSEAVTNAVRHAEAGEVSVRASATDAALLVEIADDGVGGADAAHGSGLGGLADRAAALGGTLTVISPTGAGTIVRASFPLVEA